MSEKPKLKIILIPIDGSAEPDDAQTGIQENSEGPAALQALLDRLAPKDAPKTPERPEFGPQYVIRGIPDEEGGITERSIHPDVATLLDELVHANDSLRARMRCIRQYT